LQLSGIVNMKLAIALWSVAGILFLIGLIVFGLSVFHIGWRSTFLGQKISQPSNWIDAYKIQHGELPIVPSFMSGLVLNYSPEMVVSKNIQLVNPSAQFWRKLHPSQKKKLLQLVEWLGQDSRDYEANIKMMSPPGGASIRLHRK
jgi:hypothetical protein